MTDVNIQSIQNYFNTHYTPSNPVVIEPEAGGWPATDSRERFFSADFLNHALPNILASLSVDTIVGDGVVQRYPDNLEQLVADFIVEYDATSGYNGTRMDLKTAERRFQYLTSFASQDALMEQRRNVTVSYERQDDVSEKQWYENLNAYTIARRSKFDHFAQANENEYKQFDGLSYRRGPVITQKADYADAVHSEVSNSAKQYFMNDALAPNRTRYTRDTS